MFTCKRRNLALWALGVFAVGTIAWGASVIHLPSIVTSGVQMTGATGSTAAVFDSSKNLGSSAVTATELGYLSGVTSSVCGKDQSCTLTNKSIDAGQLTGTIAAARLPNPSATTLGGVESIAAGTHLWVNSISTLGVPSLTQPDFSDLSGAASLTSQVVGTLPVANGGTGVATLSSGYVLLGNGASAVSQVAPGTSGNVLTSNGSSWVSQAAGAASAVSYQNFILNPGFRFHQANGSPVSIAAGGYFADQWYGLHSAAGTVLQYTQVAGPALTGSYYSQYYGRLLQSNASASQYGFCQPVEAAETYKLRGKSVVFAVEAQEQTGVTTLRTCIGEWTGTSDSVTRNVVFSWAATPTWIANFACDNTPADQTISASWTQLSTTATISTSANNVIVCMWTPTTQAQNNAFNISQAQLAVGSSALDWAIVARPEAVEAGLLNRYFYKSYPADTTPGTTNDAGSYDAGSASSSSVVQSHVLFPNLMKSTPTMTIYGYDGTSGSISGFNGTGHVSSGCGPNKVTTQGFTGVSCSGAGLSAGSLYWWEFTADARL